MLADKTTEANTIVVLVTMYFWTPLPVAITSAIFSTTKFTPIGPTPVARLIVCYTARLVVVAIK